MEMTLPNALLHSAKQSIWRQVLLAVAATGVLAISAKIQIPFYPVPLTLQTLVVLSIGMVFGWRLGLATIMLYLAEGAMGLPVFAGTPEKGIGLAYMFGGTGGYLIGYLLAVLICGYLAERGWGKNIFSTAGAMLLGNIAIYVPGLLWLGVLFGWDQPILAWGLTPFILGDLAKVMVACGMFPLLWKWVNHKR